MSTTNAFASVAAPMKSAKVKVVMIKDPDGSSIAFAQALNARSHHHVGPDND